LVLPRSLRELASEQSAVPGRVVGLLLVGLVGVRLIGGWDGGWFGLPGPGLPDDVH